MTKVDPKKAREVLLKEQQKNIREANEEIAAILKKRNLSANIVHRFELVPTN